MTAVSNMFPRAAAAASAPAAANANPLAGLFTGIRDAKMTTDREYIRPGAYWCRIDLCKYFQNRKRAERLGVEMTVIHVLDDDSGRGHRTGNEITDVFARESDYFLRDVKGFVAAAVNMQAEEIAEEHAMTVFGPENPLAWVVMEVSARNVVTQAGGDFTKVTYRRCVSYADVVKQIGDAGCERFFPNMDMAKLIQMESGQQAAA